MECSEPLHGQLLTPNSVTEQQHDSLKLKTGSCPGAACSSQRRTTSGGGHSSRRSQPGCPVGHDAAVTPACTPAAAAAAAAAAFSHSAADQARLKLAAMVMERQRQAHKQHQPAEQTTQVAAAAAATTGAASQPCHAGGGVGGADGMYSDLEELFEEAEGVVDTYMRHPSNPCAAKLFGADVTDALARLASHSAPSRAAASVTSQPIAAQKPSSLFRSLGLRALGFGSSSQRQPAQGSAHREAAGLNPAGIGPCQLTGAKRSKPSFSTSRDPAADRPSSRRELEPSGTDTAITAAAAAAAGEASPAQYSAGLAAAPTPPPSATSSAAADAAAAGLSGGWWGLDLSDAAAMTSSRPSPFSVKGRQSAGAALTACSKDPTAAGAAVPDGSQAGSRHPRGSLQGLAVNKPGLKSHLHKSCSVRRSSCPGIYLAGLNLSTSGRASLASEANATTDASLSGAPSAGLRVLDLRYSPRTRHCGLTAGQLSPSTSPGSATSSAIAAAAAAGAAAAITGAAPGAGSMLASGAFDSRAGANTAAAAAGTGGMEHSGATKSSGGGAGGSLQSKRSVGGAAAVSKAPKPLPVTRAGCMSTAAEVPAAAPAAAAADSPPAVFVTITSASGLGPTQQSLSRKVSSRSAGSPQSDNALSASAATTGTAGDDMAIDSSQLEAACAAAMAAVAAETGSGLAAHGQQQQQQMGGGNDSWPKLRPIRTKSRTEGPAAILNPSATGTAALGAAAGTQLQPQQHAGAPGAPGMLYHQQEQLARVVLSSGDAGSGSGFEQGSTPPNGFPQAPLTPTGTPATARPGVAATATASGAAQPASPGDLLAAAAANLAAAGAYGVGYSTDGSSARVSHTGTPNGIASSIAQMTLQSPCIFMDLPANRSSNGAQQQAAAAAAAPPGLQPTWQPQHQQHQQQQQHLPWQHLPASACNGVAVYPGDSGLVVVAGQTVTTGLIMPAAQASTNSSANGSCFYQSAAVPSAAASPACGMLPQQYGPSAADLGCGAAFGLDCAAAPAAGFDMGAAAGLPRQAGAAHVPLGAAGAAGLSPFVIPTLALGGPGFASPPPPPPQAFGAAGGQNLGAAGIPGASNARLPSLQALPQVAGASYPAVLGSVPTADGVGVDNVFLGFGGAQDMQDEWCSQQLQDLMQGSALMRAAGGDNQTGSYMF